MVRRLDSLNIQALKLCSEKIDDWLAMNVEALAYGGSLIAGDLNATGMKYSEACGYIRALNEVKEKLLQEVEAKLIRGD